jgi:epoxyqueuosine reductase
MRGFIAIFRIFKAVRPFLYNITGVLIGYGGVNVKCITKDEIRDYASSCGIDLIGFAEPDCLVKYHDLLKERENKNYSCPIEEKNYEKRINPRLIMDNIRSIISIAVSYNVDYVYEKPQKGYGIISRTSWGTDYHVILKNKMDKLAGFIKARCPDVELKCLVDNNPLLERAIAYNAGIGFFGKNSMIINEEYGSYIFLGEILCSIYFEPDIPVESKCGECELCLKACPGQAIVEPFKINANRCLSFATINKGYLDDKTVIKMGRRIYGCDTCQKVCPYNKWAKKVSRSEFMPDKLKPKHDLTDILNMDNKKFKQVFGPTASSWRGKRTIIRNAIIACANTNEKNCINTLKKILYGDNSYLRGYSAWALSIIGGKELSKDINEVLGKEGDERSKKMMIYALKNLKGDVFENNTGRGI